MHLTTRDIPLDPARSAILYIDVQNFSCRRDGGEFKDIPAAELEARCGYFFDRLARIAVPNMQKLQSGFRAAGIEVMYTVIESLTKDGRDRSLSQKSPAGTIFFCPRMRKRLRLLRHFSPGRVKSS